MGLDGVLVEQAFLTGVVVYLSHRFHKARVQERFAGKRRTRETSDVARVAYADQLRFAEIHHPAGLRMALLSTSIVIWTLLAPGADRAALEVGWRTALVLLLVGAAHWYTPGFRRDFQPEGETKAAWVFLGRGMTVVSFALFVFVLGELRA